MAIHVLYPTKNALSHQIGKPLAVDRRDRSQLLYHGNMAVSGPGYRRTKYTATVTVSSGLITAVA